MKALYKIRDDQGERTVAEDEFPIIIGAGPTADIQIPGLESDGEAAYISISREHPFVQAGKSEVVVRYNHRKLENSAWLMHGDVLEIGANEIKFKIEGEYFIIQLMTRGPVTETIRPPMADSAGQAQKIKPLSFRPQGQQKAAGSIFHYRRLIGAAIGLGFLLLIVATWFVFTAKQITIQIEPKPDQISISGSWIAPRFGGHYLLRPGTYHLHAAKECYYPFEHPFKVGAEKSQIIQFQMERLPGQVSIQAHKSGDPSAVLEGARVIIDGQKVGITPVSNLKVKAGRHIFEIQTDNYQDIKTEVQIAGCPEKQSFDFALIPGWSDVFISSIPKGASVTVDGKPAGNTPLTIELPEGSHQLQLSADGFKTWKTQLDVVPNQPQSIKDIRLQPADGTLALQTKPAGANVTIGRNFVGKTPLKVQLSANIAHEIRFSKSGYEKVSRRVQVSSGELKTLAVDLKPLWGVILFAVEPKDAQLIVDGKNQGTVPQKLELIAIPHLLEIKKQGYESYQTQIIPRPGYPQEIKITLSRLKPKSTGPAGVITARNGYTLKLIRPQPFTMGSSRREQGRRTNETLRRIKLQRPFYLGVKEVTNKEFKAFLAGHHSGTFKGQRLSPENHPVVRVTWEQAALFCNWLSAKESLPAAYVKKGNRMIAAEPLNTGYRLPTEAEWEFSARFMENQTLLKYPWGNRFPPPSSSGNYADISAKNLLPTYIENYNDGYQATAPVATFKANARGLYDLGGNVAEWCHDAYSIYTYDSNKIYVDPAGPVQGKHHVVKGSSWQSASMTKLRLAYRDYSNAKRPDLGFRICRYLK